MKRLQIILLLLVIAGKCFAPILDPRMGSGQLKPQADPTQAEMNVHQGRMRAMGQIGDVPVRTEGTTVHSSSSSSSAQGVLVAAGSGDALATQTLKDADRKLHDSSPSSTTLGLWGLAIIALGFFGIRTAAHYATRNMPEMPRTKRVTW